MNWNQLKEKIYFWDGSWRDIYIFDTDREDSSKWIDYVNKNYRIGWYNGKTNKDENKVNFDVIKEYWDGNSDLSSTANVFIDGIQINNHFFVDNQIENDIDPREFNSIEDHNKLIKYMFDLNKLLNKEIILTLESMQEEVIMRISNDGVEFPGNI